MLEISPSSGLKQFVTFLDFIFLCINKFVLQSLSRRNKSEIFVIVFDFLSLEYLETSPLCGQASLAHFSQFR